MKNKTCHTVVTFSESHRQIVERCTIDTSNLQILCLVQAVQYNVAGLS